MRRSVTAAWVALFLLLNAGAILYLRAWLAEPPPSDVVSAPEPSSALSPTGDQRIAGGVFLSGRGDGSVLRVTRGDCVEPGSEGDPEPATAWVAPPGAGPAEVQMDSLVQTLGVGRTDSGWWVVGTDASCQVKAWTSTGAGQSWKPGPIPAGAWYLNPGNDPELTDHVVSPDGPVELPEECEAVSVQTGPVLVYVVCSDDRLLVADRTASEISAAPEVGVTAVAVGPDGKVARLFDLPSCEAQLDVVRGNKLVREPYCFGNERAALGVTWAGDDLVVQIGYDLLDNPGADGAWQTRD